MSSPPLALALPSALSSPYYLHSNSPTQAPLFYRSDFYRNQSKAQDLQEHPRDPLSHTNPTSDSVSGYADSLFCADAHKHSKFFCNHENRSTYIGYTNSDSFMDSLYQHSDMKENKSRYYREEEKHEDVKKNKSCYYREESLSDFGSLFDNHLDSNSNTDSLYWGDKYSVTTMTDKPSISTCAEGNTTPYKNIDMIRYHAEKLSKLSDDTTDIKEDMNSMFSFEEASDAGNTFSDQKMLEDKSHSLPFPTLYLYHPKNCPLHKGAPPRLSPVGAISPPHRAGPPSPGSSMSRLCSPLFPRSHTLPALAAPLYYPYLYTPRARAPPREPLAPKLQSKQNASQLSLSKIISSFIPLFFSAHFNCSLFSALCCVFVSLDVYVSWTETVVLSVAVCEVLIAWIKCMSFLNVCFSISVLLLYFKNCHSSETCLWL